METGYFSDTCHAPRHLLRRFDGKYPVRGIVTSSWAARRQVRLEVIHAGVLRADEVIV